jgi:hypothetical protein
LAGGTRLIVPLPTLRVGGVRTTPTFSRQQLRRLLGRNHVRDTHVGATTVSWGQTNYSVSS